MRILVTNDDGVFAEGLRVLVGELSQVAEVLVIAPERQQSATGHAITLHKPLRLEPVTLEGTVAAYASNGTPADCVILASLSDLPQPDMVVSGINAGANLGEEVLYSGTVSAAMEGALQEIPTSRSRSPPTPTCSMRARRSSCARSSQRCRISGRCRRTPSSTSTSPTSRRRS